MDDIMEDSRFSHINKDPRFRKIPKREKKVKIDKRFQLMFKDKNFKVNYTVDKRGRPVVGTSSEDLKKYYELSSDEDEDGEESTLPSGVDYARGEVLLTDSSSDEESSEVEAEEEEEELDHGWGELDRDAERTDEVTNRLALCHMDWDRIRAIDLMVLFNSFLPQGGHIRSISIYPSEFGLQRMKEEEVKGPIELVDNSNSVKDNDEEDKEENEEGDAYSMEKLRQYQLNRLKYYYAVLVFDSPETANKIYTECDGLEYESSATRLDLRFIPDETMFDQEPREVCDQMPDISKYQPRYFTTTALQQAKVELTWDETNPERCELNQKLMSGQVDGISEADLRDYLATSSEDESGEEDRNEEDGDEGENENKDDPVSKYRSLLQEIEEQEDKKKSSDVGLEITWGVGLKNKAVKLVQEKLKEKNNDLTPFEQYVKKQKEKKKQKKKEKKKRDLKDPEDSVDEYSDDDIPSDIDINDPYFQEEFQGEFKKKDKGNDKKNKKVSNLKEESKQEQAELELLLMNDAEERNHFSYKSIQEQELGGKKKQKKKKLKTKVSENKNDDFEVNVKDDRFSALYASHHFNIDPTDPHYIKTKGMEALRAEKINRRQNDETCDNVVPSKIAKIDKIHKDPELSVLVKSIKRKTQHKGVLPRKDDANDFLDMIHP